MVATQRLSVLNREVDSDSRLRWLRGDEDVHVVLLPLPRSFLGQRASQPSAKSLLVQCLGFRRNAQWAALSSKAACLQNRELVYIKETADEGVGRRPPHGKIP
jgi:hypothetical protein